MVERAKRPGRSDQCTGTRRQELRPLGVFTLACSTGLSRRTGYKYGGVGAWQRGRFAIAVSIMSCSRRAGLSEGKGAILIDLALKSFLANRFFDTIYFAAQDSGESAFQLSQTGEVVKPRGRERFIESHGDIHVVRRTLIARDRTKYRQAHHTGTPEFLLVRFQNRDNTRALHGTNFAQLRPTGNVSLLPPSARRVCGRRRGGRSSEWR